VDITLVTADLSLVPLLAAVAVLTLRARIVVAAVALIAMTLLLTLAFLLPFSLGERGSHGH
jgi:hypothetical protein